MEDGVLRMKGRVSNEKVEVCLGGHHGECEILSLSV